MKRGLRIGKQSTMFKTKEAMVMFNDSLKSEKDMKPYICIKHKTTFWRNIKLNYGYCWKCADEIKPDNYITLEDISGYKSVRVFPLKEFHNPNINHIDSIIESDINLGSENMAWEEKKGMATKEWDKKGEEVVGKVIAKQEKIGENESTLYTIEQENGEKIGVWESGFLKIPMSEVKIGDKVKIIFDGLGKPKQKGFNPPKLFKVFIDK